MLYSDYQSKTSSEKLTLATLESAKRLIAFELHSGAVYKKQNFDISSIVSIARSGIMHEEVSSLDLVVSGTYYNDREAKILYLELDNSENPNANFLVLTQRHFFSNMAIDLPFNLQPGAKMVPWLPMIKSTSEFGVELDFLNESLNAIEGSGSLVLHNDQDFWKHNYDNLQFENQKCYIHSYNQEIPINQAVKLFEGRVETKSYSATQVSFTLKDLMSTLRDSISVPKIESLAASTDTTLDQAKVRTIYGRVNGFIPINMDVMQNNKDNLTGTIAWTTGSATITGTGTQFKTELYPGDKLYVFQSTYNVAIINSDTTLTLSEQVTQSTNSGQSIIYGTSRPKRYKNRLWKLANHALHQPTYFLQNGSNTSILMLNTTTGLTSGDSIVVNGTEYTTVLNILNNTTITVTPSLASAYPQDTQVVRSAVQNVRINDTLLVPGTDYTLENVDAELTLSVDAEKNSAPVIESIEQISMVSGSAIATGTGTSFQTYLEPGYNIRVKNTTTYYQILSVDSDTQITLTTNSAVTATNNVQYKSLIFNYGTDVLSCDVYGAVNENDELIDTVPAIVEHLLEQAGLFSYLNTTSFLEAKRDMLEKVSLAIPEKFDDTDVTTYRTVLNKLNNSILCTLYQNQDFQLCLKSLAPSTINYTLLESSDILSVSVSNTNKNMLKTANVSYAPKEYDYLTKKESIRTTSSTSDAATYLLGTSKEKYFSTYLNNLADSSRLAKKWSFLLESSGAEYTIITKLQGASIAINSIIKLKSDKLYNRMSGTTDVRYLLVERVSKSGNSVSINAIDLSGAFNKVAFISELQETWSSSTDAQKAISGFISDEYGLIGTDENSFYTNKVW